MSTSPTQLKRGKASHSQHPNTTTPQPVSTEELLNTLNDEYTREILNVLGENPISCREIANKTDMSRPTVYRRINNLDDIGVLKEQTRISDEGHHKSEYSLKEISLNVELKDGINVEFA